MGASKQNKSDGVRGNTPKSVTARPRPPFLRALGNQDPPAAIRVAGEAFHRLEVFKHDSWAATAVYQGRSRKVVCKFNRIAPLFGLPMSWVGRWLARREREVLEQLKDVSNVPRYAGEVWIDGRVAPNAIARSYIAGHPLERYERVEDDFFPALTRLLAVMHQRRMAYVDLHKRENVIVGDDGEPYLVDFQISLNLGPQRRWAFAGHLLQVAQEADRYHLLKHMSYNRPDQAGFSFSRMDQHRPWWIWAHRFVAIPPRVLRRVFLVLIGVRRGKGKPVTEYFAEDAVRREHGQQRRSA
jgi:hypothetical protein